MTSSSLKPIQSRRKVDEGCRLLREMAQRLGPGSKMPTIRDLAVDLGISKATVSDCLEDLEAQNVITRRQGSGIFVSPRLGQKTIGLVFGGNIFAPSRSPVYAQLIDRCRQRAVSHGENFRFFLDVANVDSQGVELPVRRDLEEAIRDHKLHGILLVSKLNDAQEAWLRSQNIPMYCMGSAQNEPLHMDYESIVRLGVKTLVEQGCKRLGMITPFGELRNGSSAEGAGKDLQDWHNALSEVGLSHCEPRMWQKLTPSELVPESESREADGWQAMQEWFGPATSPQERPDGIVSLDDMMTTGIIAGLQHFELRPGRDVFIATHANAGSPALLRQQESLTLLEFDPDEMVQGMFDCLERRMNGLPDNPTQTIIRPTLRVGSAVLPRSVQVV